MSTVSERRELVERMERHIKRAQAYVSNARDLLYADWPKGLGPSDRPWEYQRLLDEMLETAKAIVGVLPDSFFVPAKVEDHFGIARDLGWGNLDWLNDSDDVVEKVHELLGALDKRRERGGKMRKIMALEAKTVENGCSPEEAQSAKEMADKLRRQLP